MVTNELTVRRIAYAAATAVGEVPTPLVRSCAAETNCWEEPRLCSLSTAFRAAGCEPHAALQQREASLSIRTAFDPLHFIHEPLNHAIAKGSCCIHWQQPPHRQPTSSTKAISSAIPLARTAAFHCSKRTCPSCFREPPTKILCKREHHSDGRVTLDKLQKPRPFALSCGFVWVLPSSVQHLWAKEACPR